jgi:trimeric autotransporter adhesin
VAKKPAQVQLPPLSLKGSSAASGSSSFAASRQLPPLSPSASLQAGGEQAGYVPAEWGEVSDTPLLEDDEALSELMRDEASQRQSSSSSAAGGGPDSSIETSVLRRSSGGSAGASGSGSSSSKRTDSKRASADGVAPAAGAAAALAAWPEAAADTGSSATADSSALDAAGSAQQQQNSVERLETMGSDERYDDAAAGTSPLISTDSTADSTSTAATAAISGVTRMKAVLKQAATFSSLPVSAQPSSSATLRTVSAAAGAFGKVSPMPGALLLRSGNSMPRLLSTELQHPGSSSGSPTAAAAAAAAATTAAGAAAAAAAADSGARLNRQHSGQRLNRQLSGQQLGSGSSSPAHSDRHMTALHRMQHAAGKAAAEASKAAAEADIAEFNKKLAQEGMHAVSASQMKLMHNVVKTLSGAPQPGAALAGDVAAEVRVVLCYTLCCDTLCCDVCKWCRQALLLDSLRECVYRRSAALLSSMPELVLVLGVHLYSASSRVTMLIEPKSSRCCTVQ